MDKKPEQRKKPLAGNNKAVDVEKKTQLLPPQKSNMEALQFIDGCVAQAPLGRMMHVQAQAALQQLSGALGVLERLKKTPKEGG